MIFSVICMVVNRTKKVRKLRGSRTYGWGSPKKHRGAGSRGGRGMAGSGKKGQQKMTALHLVGRRIGKSSFKRPAKVIVDDNVINLSRLEVSLEKYVKYGIAKKTGAVFDVDLDAADITKVLGSGNISIKMNVTARKFSAKAVEKIEAVGGKVTVKE